MRTLFVTALFLMFSLATLRAQDNYEIQVYGADTVEPGATMVEFHTNYTAEGSKTSGTSTMTAHATLSSTGSARNAATKAARSGPAVTIRKPTASVNRTTQMPMSLAMPNASPDARLVWYDSGAPGTSIGSRVDKRDEARYGARE